MYNKYRSFQKIITIIILFFPAQKIYIDTFITPQINPLYTLHPFQTFQNSTHSHTKKQPKTHKKLPFSHTFPHFYINLIPYNTIQPPTNTPKQAHKQPYKLHFIPLYSPLLHPIPYPINPNNKVIIFSFLSLFSFFPAPPLKPFYIPCMLPYILFISLYNLIHLYNPYLYPYTLLKAFKALYSQYNPITLYNIH